MDAATFHARRLRTHTGGDYDSSPSWSADGKRLVFASARNGHTSLYVINVDGSRPHLIAARGTAPAWSPDGRVIAYHSRCGGIKFLTPSGTDITRHLSGGSCTAIGVGGTPIWSPDSKKIAIGAPHSFEPGIYLMDANGGHLRLVTRSRPLTSFDAQRVVAWKPGPKA
jgi:TolB protein